MQASYMCLCVSVGESHFILPDFSYHYEVQDDFLILPFLGRSSSRSMIDSVPSRPMRCYERKPFHPPVCRVTDTSLLVKSVLYFELKVHLYVMTKAVSNRNIYFKSIVIIGRLRTLFTKFHFAWPIS